ncbi:hypothetical protein [Flagellimonas sp.]|uniref:hypothetical protein n=1 Tax=Flagellimonas sp. TaxID=2058762 RepID=UPI003AB44E7F
MKKLFTLLTLLLCTLGGAQTLTGKLVNPLKGMKGMDIAIWPLGLDRSIFIGQLKADGTLEFTFPPKDSFLSKNEEQQMVVSDVKYALAFNCLGQGEAMYPEIMAARINPISLWYKGRYAGVLFPVTSEDMIPWLEDEAYNNPEKGTFYELIYVDQATTLTMQCTTTYQFSGDVVEATYDYQLELEAGLNFIAYTIEEIFETDPKITSFKPSKVTVKNIREGLDGIQWFAKYF